MNEKEDRYVYIMIDENEDYIGAFDSEEELTRALGEFIKPDLDTDCIYDFYDVDLSALRVIKTKIR